METEVFLKKEVSKRNRFKFEKGKVFKLIKETPLISQVEDKLTGIKYYLDTNILEKVQK